MEGEGGLSVCRHKCVNGGGATMTGGAGGGVGG